MDTYGEDITEFKDAKSRYVGNLAEMAKQIALCFGFKELRKKQDGWKDHKIYIYRERERERERERARDRSREIERLPPGVFSNSNAFYCRWGRKRFRNVTK